MNFVLLVPQGFGSLFFGITLFTLFSLRRLFIKASHLDLFKKTRLLNLSLKSL